MEPAAERAAWLEAQPQPSHLDRHPARPSVAGFGNPLIAVNRAATVVRGCKAEIGRKLPPVAKLPMEDLTHEHMGRGRANPGEPGQGQRLLGGGLLSVLIARGLELREHVHHQPQTAAFPFELCLEVGRQSLAIAGSEFIKPPAPIRPGGLIIANTLGHQQALDPPDVLDALVDQPLTLSASATAILLLGCRHADHTANLGLAPAPGHEGTHEQELCGKVGDDGGMRAAYRGGCPSLPEPLIESDTPWKALPTSSGCVSLT